MTLSTEECVAAIERHSAGFAEATRDTLTAPVGHCPGWSVADLVWHLTEVHWFWATIVEEQAATPPDESRCPPRADDAGLVGVFEAGATRIADVLRAADQSAACWTWAPEHQDVAFVTRHQVQEAAVHHWDAVHAAGGELVIEPAVAADSVDEFLAFSVSSDTDHEDPPGEPLMGRFVVRASDTGDAWTVTDGDLPGTVRVSSGATSGPTLEATASDLILWLYGRRDIDTSAVPADLVGRFKALCSTD